MAFILEDWIWQISKWLLRNFKVNCFLCNWFIIVFKNIIFLILMMNFHLFIFCFIYIIFIFIWFLIWVFRWASSFVHNFHHINIIFVSQIIKSFILIIRRFFKISISMSLLKRLISNIWAKCFSSLNSPRNFSIS